MRQSRAALQSAPLLLILFSFSSFSIAASARADAEVSDFRTRTEKWIETRQIISEEKTDWEMEQDTLRATRDLLRKQKRALEEEIAELEKSSGFADEERRELLLTRGEHQRTGRALEERIRGMESDVLALVPQLPEPLQKKLEPLIVQIPTDPDNTRQTLGARLMNVLGVLAQTEKWNSTATFVGETRAVTGEQRIAIRTLYWGLGQAFYVDNEGTTAGIGRPGPEGWVFVEQPELAGDARKLLDIYEGNVDAIEFVRLPIEVQ
jgi:hypothetical protein